MRRSSLVLVLVLGLSHRAGADVPATGVLVATQSAAKGDDVELQIHRITTAGIERIHSSTHTLGRTFEWSNSNTLWTLSEDDTTATVEKIVDGKVASTMTIRAADWKANALPADASLRVTKTGQVWLEGCLRHKYDIDGGDRCLAPAFLRVDVQPYVRSKKRPAQMRTHTRLAFPKAKAPAGFAVTLGKVVVGGERRAGATCAGPSARATFPDASDDEGFAMKPSRVTWLRTSPAVVRIEGHMRDPLDREGIDEAVYVDCNRVQTVESFGHGLWAIHRDPDRGGTAASQWTLYRDDKELGTFVSEELEVAPR